MTCALPEWKRCCCNCRYRRTDYSHPHTDGKRVTAKRGYICMPPASVRVAFSGWSAHGLCELHKERK